ncbi:NAD(P)-dependent oxidoreductase [Streptomyces sp. NPDC052396]|uniref:NAD(P)-dependent oxidoreductase n=1 Tax=Streptomyces sp. NPDC052396 TaxID=3365689 RepID=UPI0037D3E8D8
MNVTVMGLGSMGSALAGAFLAGGHRTTVWNRTPGRAEALAGRGAEPAATPAEAVRAGELVVVCLATYETVHRVLGPVAVHLAGRTLVNLTSGTPEEAREMAAWAGRHGAGYLDGAIMTTPPGIGDPTAMLLYSGPRSAFEAGRDALAALGDPLYLGPEAGLASLYDTALLGVMWSALTGWLHGVALVGADGGAGTSAVAFTEVANRWLGAVSGFAAAYAPQVDAGAYPGDDATLDVHLAAIGHLVSAGAARGIDSGLPAVFQDLVGRAVAAGHGKDGWARLVEFLSTEEQA